MLTDADIVGGAFMYIETDRFIKRARETEALNSGVRCIRTFYRGAFGGGDRIFRGDRAGL